MGNDPLKCLWSHFLNELQIAVQSQCGPLPLLKLSTLCFGHIRSLFQFGQPVLGNPLEFGQSLLRLIASK